MAPPWDRKLPLMSARVSHFRQSRTPGPLETCLYRNIWPELLVQDCGQASAPSGYQHLLLETHTPALLVAEGTSTVPVVLEIVPRQTVATTGELLPVREECHTAGDRLLGDLAQLLCFVFFYYLEQPCGGVFDGDVPLANHRQDLVLGCVVDFGISFRYAALNKLVEPCLARAGRV